METTYYILKNYLSAAHWLSLIGVFIATLAVFMVKAKRRWTQHQVWPQSQVWYQFLLISLLITYIFFILLITLITRTPADAPKAKLIPFWSWYEVIAHHDKGLAVEIILNIIFFMPVGVLMRVVGVRMRRVLIFSLPFSLSVELTQYFTCWGLCEIFDDVFGNTCGACIGWYIGGALEKVWSSRSRQK